MLRWYFSNERSLQKLSKGIAIGWINEKLKSSLTKALLYGMSESCEFCFTDRANVRVESFSQALPRSAFVFDLSDTPRGACKAIAPMNL